MLQNNNLKICRRLVWRDIKFHKGRSIFLVTAAVAVSYLISAGKIKKDTIIEAVRDENV